MADNKPPFDKSYVLNLTVKNMHKPIETSINKTSARMSDFEPGTDKWQEVIDTLHVLNQLNKLVDDFVLHNKALFSKGDE